MSKVKFFFVPLFVSYFLALFVWNFNSIVEYFFEDEYEKPNILFNRYLNDFVKDTTLLANGYVIIINGKTCKSCVSKSINTINKIKDWRNIKLIYCGEEEKMLGNLEDKIFYIDRYSQYFKFNITPDHDPIIIIEDKKIIGIKELSEENLKDLGLL